MVKCKDCNQEMRIATKCTTDKTHIRLNGAIYKRDTSYYDVNKRCHDCGIVNKRGNLHHFGCDVERCPRCKGQLISCNCTGKILVGKKRANFSIPFTPMHNNFDVNSILNKF